MNVSRSVLLEHSALQMYQIVADVERYPEFLSWCDAVEIKEQDDHGITATMKISYGGLNIEFTTQNINIEGESIEMRLVEGPFTNLHGIWSFKPLSEEACKTSINMDFVFDNSIAKAMMGKVFEKLINKQLESFQQRAKQLSVEAKNAQN